MKTREVLKNAVCAALTLAVAVLAAGVGCSMDHPAKNGGTFSIKIEDDPNAPRYYSVMQDIMTITTPGSAADFSCFAVNVTGPGIVSNNRIGNECTILGDNMNGRGVGIVSDPVARGKTIELNVIPGKDRRVDVYGVFPPTQECGGSNDIATDQFGYYLGGKDVEIHENTQVTVQTFFQSGKPPSVACKNDLWLRAGINPPHEVYYKDASIVDISTSAPSPTPTASPSPSYTPLPQQNYADILNPDGTYFEARAYDNTYYPALEFRYNVTNLTMSNFSSMEVVFSAAAGKTSGSCGPSGSVVPSVAAMEVWKQSTGLWVGGFQPLQASLQPQFYGASVPNPSEFVFPANSQKFIIARIRTATAASYCGFVRVDFAALSLRR